MRALRVLALALLLCLAAVPAARAEIYSLELAGAAPVIPSVSFAAPPRPARYVHREGRYWRYFLPATNWRAVESESSLDVTDPLGELYAGYGFVYGFASPLTHEQVIEFVKRYVPTGGSWDVHPLSDFKLGELGPPRSVGPAQRRVVEYAGHRTDLDQDVRGVMNVDVLSASGVYAFALGPRVAPVGQFDEWNQTLATIQSLFSYKPHTPR